MEISRINSTGLDTEVVERFLRYSAITSESDASVTEVPSTPGQWDLIRLLEGELTELGAQDVHVSEHACLTARFPATGEGEPMGFVAHVDTAPVGLSPKVKARVVRYQGTAIHLGSERYLSPRDFPELDRYTGEDIIVGDGTSVLGADDKAALAEIMTALAHLNERPHSEIFVAFVPDEEIGLRGAKMLDLERFRPTYAYTLDCGPLGEVVFETFNAGYAYVDIEGVTAHPMSAKGVLVNPTLMAAEFTNMFDYAETPENTEGREGYIWVQEIRSDQARAHVLVNVRDHSLSDYKAKFAKILKAVDDLRRAHPTARVAVRTEDVYGNIADSMTAKNRVALDRLYKVLGRLDVEITDVPMRGGTDGSYLSTKGIFTPNFFTGAHNFHSRFEFLPVSSAVIATKAVQELMASDIGVAS